MSVSLYGSGNTVIQVVQGTLGGSSVTTTSTASFVTTGLSASITPQSTTSKILILTTFNQAQTASGSGLYFTLYKNNTTNIAPTGAGTSQALCILYNNAGVLEADATFSVIDSPATTSSVTYTGYFAVSGGTGSFNQNNGTSNIILMEISGS